MTVVVVVLVMVVVVVAMVAMQEYVVSGLGARFVEPQPADLAALYAESDPLAPIIFVLSTGTDPAAGHTSSPLLSSFLVLQLSRKLCAPFNKKMQQPSVSSQKSW